MKVVILVLALACTAAAQRINFDVAARPGQCIVKSFPVHPDHHVDPKNDFLPEPQIIQKALDDAVGPASIARNVEGYGTFSADATTSDAEITFNARERVLRRLTKNAYGDGFETPRGTCVEGQFCLDPMANRLGDRESETPEFLGSNLPNPRLISSIISTSEGVIPSRRNLHDLTAHWGQMLAHDTTLVPENGDESAILDIAIPELDPIFDPEGSGAEFMAFNRAHHEERCSGITPRGTLVDADIPREMNNEISSIIDGTMVYGGIGGREALLRGENGELATSPGDLLPLNDLPLNEFTAQDNPRGSEPGEQFFGGDVRTSEAPGLSIMINLMVREHNRLARHHVKWLKKAGKPVDSDVVFAWAKKVLIAEIQAISYNEWLPALFGEPFKAYKGYQEHVIADLFHEFSAATRRFGHSLINGFLPIVKGQGDLAGVTRAELSEHLFNGLPLINNNDGGIEPVLGGILCIRSQRMDHIVTPALQQRLFPAEPEGTDRDLVALNIMRGREHGIADYNSVRKALKLEPLTLFGQINPMDDTVGRRFAQVYGDIDRVDLFMGAISEAPAKARKGWSKWHQTGFAEFGETIRAMFELQFANIRDADRFFFQRLLTKKQQRGLPSLATIIRLNTKGLSRDLFPRFYRHSIFFHPLFCRSGRFCQCQTRPKRLSTKTCDAVYRDVPDLADSTQPVKSKGWLFNKKFRFGKKVVISQKKFLHDDLEKLY